MNRRRNLCAALTAAVITAAFSSFSLKAEEVTLAWDEETRVPVLRRKIATAINVYSDGKEQGITHEEGVLDGVYYDILRVNPSAHTKVQVDYSEEPKYLNELIDQETLDSGMLYAGGINAGYFSNEGNNYGQPVGAVRRNNQWTSWYSVRNTPAYGNGFATAYITGDDLSLKYHGWQGGEWAGDDSWHWSTGYTLSGDYAVSGSYTYFADGKQTDITNGDHGEIDYRTFGRAVTILAQKENKQFLLITIYGTVSEEKIKEFLSRLKVYDAIRMDGGGSTQMVYDTLLVKEMEPELEDTKIVEEPTDGNTEVIGYVTVNVDQLRVRSGARTESTMLGYADNGERYQVYEITKDKEYTWYRIGSDRWIAGTEDWVDYEEAETTESKPEESPEAVSGTKLKVTVNVDKLNIRADADVSAKLRGQAEKGRTYDVLETKTASGYTWYRIGDDQWIAGTKEWVTEIEQ